MDAQASQFVFPPTAVPGITGTATTAQLRLPSSTSTAFVRGQSATIAVSSEIGSLTGLALGAAGDRQPIPGLFGDLWLDAASVCFPMSGVQTGQLLWTVAVPPTAALAGTCHRWQPIALMLGSVWLGAPGSAYLP